MTKIQSQSTSNPTSISQVAAQAALEGPQGFIAEMNHHFQARHDKVVERLNGMSGIQCQSTDGTFYCFPSVQELIARSPGIDDDLGLAEHLIEKAGVALVPGSAFGSPGHMRLSIATSMDLLMTAMDRVEVAIQQLF
jgi:aspartate aminotransferase